ncbi:hypothetical protein R1flu_019171 [Riccia fluitans]|uniref:Uncharacterized protein n=1 Tax=Riccia fluitans TaxID=41844 RepID=A0ABD1ZHW6_9MARC
MEGMAGLVAKEAEQNCRDNFGGFRFHGLHCRGSSALKAKISGAMGVAIANMANLGAVIFVMVIFPTAPVGVSGFFRLPVISYHRPLPIKSLLDLLSTLLQLYHGVVPWLELQTTRVTDVGLHIP